MGKANSETVPLLQVKNLHSRFMLPGGALPALRGVSFELRKGEILALVGESGSGKTLTGLSLLNLLERPAEIHEGQILFEGNNVLDYSPSQLLGYRGGRVAMIFQEPMTALNPVFSIGTQIAEVLITHLHYSRRQARARAAELLAQVGIPEPELRLDAYPFQLSGGMRQRAMIAMALAAAPDLLIADEPTTALDVTIQAQILTLIKNLAREKNMAVLLITHNLGIVAQMADSVAIMYAGKIVESGPVASVLQKHVHPYTGGLLASLPTLGPGSRLTPIPGQAPALAEIGSGCAFLPRCGQKKEICSGEISSKKAGRQHFYHCIY